jgi:pyridoxine 4-dehydrogenase
MKTENQIVAPLASVSAASKAGTFKIGGQISVVRLGFGAMRVTGNGIWGAPASVEEARRVLLRVRELGITLIDTADSYGPHVSEQLINETLHPYNGILIATKGGLTRPGPNVWNIDGRPEYLRSTVLGSLKRLGLTSLPLWQLHRIDPNVPRDEQFGGIAEMRAEGLIRHVGLSQVSAEEIEAALAYFPVATVQNLYNLTNRASEDVVDYCEAHGIGFMPWYPLANGALAKPGSKISAIAAKYQATPGQIALAWLLARSPVMLPIPGTGSVAHLDENTAAAGIALSGEDIAALNDVS